MIVGVMLAVDVVERRGAVHGAVLRMGAVRVVQLTMEARWDDGMSIGS